MKRFYLQRNTDISGISGTGNILEGCQFDNGKCAVIWLSDKNVMSWYDNIDVIINIHGHNGATVLIWIDDESSNTIVTQKSVQQCDNINSNDDQVKQAKIAYDTWIKKSVVSSTYLKKVLGLDYDR